MAMDQAASRQGGERGRQASTPAQLPATGWKDVLLRVYENIAEHRILAIAAGVTFYVLLAIFPAIAAFVALYSLFADPATISSHLEALSGVIPKEALGVIGDQLRRVSAQGAGALGFASVFGLLVSLWSANAGMKAIFDAINVVYQEREKRGFFKLNAVSLVFTLAGMSMVALALAIMIALPPALDALGLPQAMQTAVSLLRWPVLLIVVALATAVIYRYAPSRDEPKWRWVSWGGAFAALGWLAVSALFSWYAAHLGDFNKTYGSLGAVIGFMLWMWLSSIVLLIGAELNAEMEHQTEKDTTEGAPRPMGERRARMADTIGPSAS
ncbi:MAG: YihY/virulence factor BrkB family protein [Methylocystis sp.]|uniref:YihY/virulence factor BrkB family protein n=1 Tax=Methylocystis sp. TaxID=1911079 RepID=UPI003DA5E335